MTDAEHAAAIREALTRLIDVLQAAENAGLRIWNGDGEELCAVVHEALEMVTIARPL
jgi:hypothetical protein